MIQFFNYTSSTVIKKKRKSRLNPLCQSLKSLRIINKHKHSVIQNIVSSKSWGGKGPRGQKTGGQKTGGQNTYGGKRSGGKRSGGKRPGGKGPGGKRPGYKSPVTTPLFTIIRHTSISIEIYTQMFCSAIRVRGILL